MSAGYYTWRSETGADGREYFVIEALGSYLGNRRLSPTGAGGFAFLDASLPPGDDGHRTCRLQLGETPIFQEMKAKGGMVKNPWREAFLSANIEFILVAIVGLIGQGVVWYSGQFWALYLLQTVKKLDVLTSSYICRRGVAHRDADLILSDGSRHHRPEAGHSGGMALASLTYYPLYAWLGQVTNPGAVNYPIAI